MQPLTCTCCGNRHAIGILFENPSIRICASCRSVVLTFLKQSGVVLDERNWLVAELCIDSHHVESAWFEYYDSVDRERRTVVKAVHASKREGLKPIKSGHPPYHTFYIVDDSANKS